MIGTVQIGWDIPFGPADDPPEHSGLAALAARYLTSERVDGPGRFVAQAGWHEQHSFLPHRTSFSWAAAHVADSQLTGLLASLRQRPSDGQLATIRAEQSDAIAREAADPMTALQRALHRAAWGESRCLEVSGSDETLVAIDSSVLNEYLDRSMSDVVDLRIAGDDPSPGALWPCDPRQDDDRRWREGTEIVGMLLPYVLVGVQFRFNPQVVDDTALKVIGEVLGARAPGLLHDELLDRRGLVHAAGAACRVEHGWPTVVAFATAPHERVLECAARLSGMAGDLHRVPAESWARAGASARRRALAWLGGPFAAIDEERLRALRRTTGAQIAAEAPSRAADLARRPVHPVGACARAVVGNFDNILERRLERTW